MRRLMLISALWLACSVGWATNHWVRATGGNDSNTGLSFAQGWATIQKAIDTVTSGSGHTVYVCGTFTPAVTLDFDVTGSTAIAPNRFIGANASDGSNDGTVSTWSGASLGVNDDLTHFNSLSYYVIENIDITSATQYNVYIQSIRALHFRNCRIRNASDHGIYHIATSGQKVWFEDCEIDGNGTSAGTWNGFAVNTAARGHVSFVRCSIHDNDNHGVYDSLAPASNMYVYHESIDCLYYGNGADGLNIVSTTDYMPLVIRGCTFVGNASDGVSFAADVGFVSICDSIFRSNGGYGINTNSGSVNQFAVIERLCSHNNTSGHIDINGGTLPDNDPSGSHILENPSFTSETDGSENLTPTNANLYKTIALPRGGTTYEYIGAIQPQAVGGGDQYPYPRLLRR